MCRWSAVSVEAEIALVTALDNAKIARERTEMARDRERVLVTKFIHEARRQHWSWESIGEKLQISDNAVRTYYKRNRMRVTP